MERTVNGATIAYTDHGAGPPIVLLHGGLLDGAANWGMHLPALADGHRVVVPDSRGHGRSDNRSGKLTYEVLADDVAAFVAALGLDRPLVVGYSDGGITALQLALRHPGVAGGLVLGGIAVAADDHYHAFLEQLGMGVPGAPDEEALRRSAPDFHAMVAGLHGDRWPTLPEETTRLWHALPEVSNEQLATVDVPVVVVAGELDEPSASQALPTARALPRGEVAIIPGAGHEAGWRSLFADIVLDAAQRWGAPAQSTFRQIEGRDIGGSVSLLLVTNRDVGTGPKLHRHPYDETFLLRSGTASFLVDGVESTGHGGDVIVVAAGLAHRFTNAGPGPLEMVNVHAADVVVTEWLE